LTKKTKGIVLSISAALAVSNVYIFSKAALQEVHMAQFGLYWFGLGIIWNLVFIFVTKKHSSLLNISKSSLKVLTVIAVLDMFGTIFFFFAINTVENPAVVSFLANINPFIITVLGFILLHERFNIMEGAGMFVTLLGAFTISYYGSEIGSLFMNGTQYVLISGIIYAFATIIAKKNIHRLEPSLLAISRITLLFFASLAAMVYFGLSFKLPSSALLNISIGSVLGPFLTATLGYFSLKYIEVSKAAMVRSIRSLFVLAGSYLFFFNVPNTAQLIGGGLTIIGVILISMGKIKLKSRQ